MISRHIESVPIRVRLRRRTSRAAPPVAPLSALRRGVRGEFPGFSS